MKIIKNLIALSLFAVGGTVAQQPGGGGLRRRLEDNEDHDHEDHDGGNHQNMVQINVYNAAYQQPFSPFFVMTHDAHAEPIFQVGKNATAALALLAENGDPSLLMEKYSNNNDHVGYVGKVMENAPYFGGESLTFWVPYDEQYPYLTIASMAVNTNDCFVALVGVRMEPKAKYDSPGFDAGSEENNELCSSIPGPACADVEVSKQGNIASGNGEGFVHIHRGFFGVGPDLSQAGYDWRNPMMQVEMKF